MEIASFQLGDRTASLLISTSASTTPFALALLTWDRQPLLTRPEIELFVRWKEATLADAAARLHTYPLLLEPVAPKYVTGPSKR